MKKITEIKSAGRHNFPQRGYRESLFVFLIVTLSIYAPTAVLGQESSLSTRQVGDGYFQLTYDTMEGTVPDAGILSIKFEDKPAVNGELEIICDTLSVVRVDAQLAFKADNRAAAKEIKDLIQLSLKSDEENLILQLDIDEDLLKDFKRHKPNADIQITVPLGTRLEIDAPYLQLTCSGPIGGLAVQNSYQPVEIEGASGHLSIGAVNTRISVENLTGSFEISNSNGKIILTDITVTDLQSSALRSASAQTENADIFLTRYSGPANIRVTRGRIRGREVTLTGRQSFLRNSGGKIDMRFEEISESTRLQVRNAFEDVRLEFRENISATFNLTARDDGSIDLRNIPHRIDKVTERKFEAIAGEGLAQIRVTTKHGGNISIKGHH